MQFKTLAIVTLASLSTMGAMAQKKKVGRKVTPASKIVTAEKKVQPVPADSFSYAAGQFNSGSLKQFLTQNQGIAENDYAEVARGLQANISAEEAKRILAYAAGLRIAQMNKENVLPAINKMATGDEKANFVNESLFVKGLVDGLTNQTQMSDSVAQAYFMQQQEYVKQETVAKNRKFIADYAKANKDVKRTESGLQYRILKAGTGVVATDTNTVEVNYEGKLIDGTIFDSSYQRGRTAEFKPSQVIKGWTEALKLMPEGSTWELVIPAELGYGERESGPIPANSTLVFKVEVVKVK